MRDTVVWRVLTVSIVAFTVAFTVLGCGREGDNNDQNTPVKAATKSDVGGSSHSVPVGVEIVLDADGSPRFKKLQFLERDGSRAESEF